MELYPRSNSDHSSNYGEQAEATKKLFEVLEKRLVKNFKREFVKYLVGAFSSESLVDVLDNKFLYVTEDDLFFL
jgi:hypothetical protein